MTRILLLELIAVDRFHRGIAFPFVRGMLSERGHDCRWIRFGLPARARQFQSESGIDLTPEDRTALSLVLQRLQPSHMLCNVEPAPGLVQEILNVVPGARIGFLSEDVASRRPLAPHRVRTDGHEIGRFVGDTDSTLPRNPFDTVTPHYLWEPGNEEASRAPSLPFIVCGQECTFRKSVSENPFFASVDISRCTRLRGCAFCVGTSDGVPFRNQPIALFRRQLEALKRTHPPWEGRLSVRGIGQPILLHVDDVAGVLCESDVAPIDLLIDGRPDAIVKGRERIVRALERLRDTGHRIHLALTGIESFVQTDLDRLNKGVSFSTNLQAVRVLFELEYAFAETFAFREHGGLSLILFTPWTTPDELLLNLAILRRARLQRLTGKLFDARLRLYPSLPLHAKAQQEGLLLDRYEDAELDTARANFYDDETPWRFAHPALGAASRLLVRLGRPAAGPRDESDRAIEALLASGGRGGSLALAEAIVDAATTEESESVSRLATATEALLRAGPGSSPSTLPVSCAPSLLAFELGRKPVLRLECEEFDALGTELDSLRKRVPIAIERKVEREGRERLELFVGHDRQHVLEAVELTSVVEQADDDEHWPAAVRRLGQLLGYPDCCAEAFSQAPHFHLDSYTWLHIRNRVEAEGSVDPLLNPGPGELISHVPCSLKCEASRSLAQAVLDERVRRHGAAPETLRSEILARHQNPWALIVDRQAVGAELVAADPNAAIWDYSLVARSGWDRLLDRIAEGDALQVGTQRVNVMRDGRLHAALGGRVFLWWNERALQGVMWDQLVRLRLGEMRVDADPRQAVKDVQVRAGPVAEGIARLLRSMLLPKGRSCELGAYRVLNVLPHREKEACVVMTNGSSRIVVMVARSEETKKAFARAGPLAVFLPRDQALDSREKKQALELLAKRIALLLQAARRS